MGVPTLDENWLVLWRPDVALAVILQCGSYFALAGPLRPRFSGSVPINRQQGIAACMVFTLLYLAMGPLSLLAEHVLFTARVLQMLLLTQVMPPLLFLAVPNWLFERIATAPYLGEVVRASTRPVVAVVVYNLLATVFLLPGPLGAALANDLVHFAVQYSLIISAIFLWWPLLSRVPQMPQLSPGRQLLYLIFSMNFMMPIVVFLLFAQDAWYPFYAAGEARLNVASLADQQVGAVVMVVGMAVIYALRAIRPFLSHCDSAWYE
ncbi:cytochrome c oxidase assembly protein [Alicyclobacillus mengziensis]|uniref:Cytochrome c oxidase assembly protein n=1 Tax=Alicyclobacillus mengziensis TaxID=2931921 RepID=A0A9X7VWU5_9BACL|nr:cytochrome c oxidase assembly protein [Alicyclobacillus mengziensis]QSO46536.1 cytochrome c oxidase assembly protein [Alicyclobacillus mengziensis]